MATIVGPDTSSVERSVAKSQNTGCATGSVLKIMCNATDRVLRKEKYVDRSTASHQTHRTPTPQLTTRSAMASARRWLNHAMENVLRDTTSATTL